MPPALFTRSAHHSVPRRPAAPTGAAMPARMARTPILTGSAGTPGRGCADPARGAPTTPAAAAAPPPAPNSPPLVLLPPSLPFRPTGVMRGIGEVFRDPPDALTEPGRSPPSGGGPSGRR